jgi:hypothetical protein
MGLKIGTPLGLIAFGVTLAYYVTTRISPEALNFALGALCGVAVSVPVVLGLLAALGKAGGPSEVEDSPELAPTMSAFGTDRPSMPQVIVIPPPQGQYSPTAAMFGNLGEGGSAYPRRTNIQSDRMVNGRDWRIIEGNW